MCALLSKNVYCIFPAHTSDIVQIAAICGEERFNTYVMPTQDFAPQATAATGLHVKDEKLCHQGEPLKTVNISEALLHFMDFIQRFHEPILAGHNSKGFDVPILIHHLKSLNMVGVFKRHIFGCLDTLILARYKIPGAGSYTQESLVHSLLDRTYNAHNALDDVALLQDLYYHSLKISSTDTTDHLFTIDYVICLKSLKPLVDAKVFPSPIRRLLANSSLGLEQLKVVHQLDPDNGIDSVFTEPCGPESKPRITTDKSLINRVNKYLFENI